MWLEENIRTRPFSGEDLAELLKSVGIDPYGGQKYSPNPGQALFHRLPCQFKAFSGGWGSGKTYGCLKEIYDDGLRYPGAIWLIGRMFSTELRDTTWKTFLEEIVNPAHIRELYNSDKRMELYLKNGSVFLARSLENPYKFSKGLKLRGAYFDEADELKEWHFHLIRGRFRWEGLKKYTGPDGKPLKPKIIVSTNPSQEMWVKNLFIKNSLQKHFQLKAGFRNSYIFNCFFCLF